jgi:hypothetical protein
MSRDIEHAKRLLNDPLYNESFDKLAESIFNNVGFHYDSLKGFAFI